MTPLSSGWQARGQDQPRACPALHFLTCLDHILSTPQQRTPSSAGRPGLVEQMLEKPVNYQEIHRGGGNQFTIAEMPCYQGANSPSHGSQRLYLYLDFQLKRGKHHSGRREAIFSVVPIKRPTGHRPEQ